MAATVNAPDTDGQGAWLSPRDGQLALGVGERTLFRRIQRGQLQRRQRADGRVEVWIANTHPSTTVPETDSDGQAPMAAAEQALAVVDRLNGAVAQQVTPLLTELAITRQELVRLAQENGQLRERVATLEAQLTPTVPETVTDRPTPNPRNDYSGSRPWWAWLWAWRR